MVQDLISSLEDQSGNKVRTHAACGPAPPSSSRSLTAAPPHPRHRLGFRQDAAKLVRQLNSLLKSPEANKSEIEKIVGAAARTFSVVEGYKFPGEALGYSTKPSYGNQLD